MCTRYISPSVAEVERLWHVGAGSPTHWDRELFTRSRGPFIRRARDVADYRRELVAGQWGLIPWFASSPKLDYATINARAEEAAVKRSFKEPWLRGQRCVIPAESFDEPNWESGRNVRWRFTRTDRAPWGLAGLWNNWVDKSTGEVHESYTMLTLNADDHALMRRMHKPDPKLGPNQQDKRSVVPIELHDVDAWLAGTLDVATALLRLPPADAFDAGPVTGPPPQSTLF